MDLGCFTLEYTEKLYSILSVKPMRKAFTFFGVDSSLFELLMTPGSTTGGLGVR